VCLHACRSVLNWNTCARTDSDVESSDWRVSLNTLRAEWSTQLPVVKYDSRLTSHRLLDNMAAWRAATDRLAGCGETAALASIQQRAATDQLAGYGSTTALASRQRRAATAALGESCNISYSYCVLGCDAVGCDGHDVSQKRTAFMLTVEPTRLYTGTACTASGEVIPTSTSKEPASLTNHTKSRLVSYRPAAL
jgi:hypothetical protein